MSIRIKTWQWIILAILAYVFFIIAYIPASHLANFIYSQSQGQVRLSNVSGTLFEGNAGIAVANGFMVQNLDWQLNPWSLFLLRANVDLKGGAIRNSEQIYVKANVVSNLLSSDQFTLANSQLFIPAKSVLSQLQLPVVVTASGRFRIDIDELEMTPTCTGLSGKGAWLNAEVDTPAQAVSLGSFEANLSCTDGTLNVEVLPDNSLNLSASVSVNPETGYSVSGQFSPDPDLPPVISQTADGIFAKNNQGFYIINL